MFRPSFFYAFVLVITGWHGLLAAQVLAVSGGASTLYQAGGGNVTLHAPSYDLTLGAGVIDGHILEGVSLLKKTTYGTYILGDDRISFRLPTDIFDTSHFLLARGIGYSTTRERSDLLAFAGGTATDYDSPIFDGVKFNDPTAIFFYNRKINDKLQIFSDTIVSNKMTGIEAVQWEPLPKFDLGFSGGVGANQPYAAASLNLSRPRIDLQAAYIAAGQNFQRVALVSPLLTEVDRENLSLTVKANRALSLTGVHLNYLVPQYPSTTNVHSSIDEGSVNLYLFRTSLNGSIYRSSYLDESNHSVSLSAARDLTERIHFMANYLSSRPQGSFPTSSFISTVSETINSRLSVNENITNSEGNTSVNFGGQLLSNLITINAAYENFYVPAHNNSPFQQSLILDVKTNVFGRVTLHAASFVDPTGHLRYTFDANTVLSRDRGDSTNEHVTMESAVMRGCVTDDTGQVIEGAALLIDQKLVYTDSTGCFFLREHKPRTHTLAIVLTEFLSSGNWFVASAPRTITSLKEENAADAPIFVVLKHIPTEASNSPGVPSETTARK